MSAAAKLDGKVGRCENWSRRFLWGWQHHHHHQQQQQQQQQQRDDDGRQNCFEPAAIRLPAAFEAFEDKLIKMEILIYAQYSLSERIFIWILESFGSK